MRFFTPVFILLGSLACATATTAATKEFDFKGLSVGAQTSPEKVMKDTGVKCGPGAEGAHVCNGMLDIGPVATDANLYIDGKGILQRIVMTLTPDAFGNVISAFTEKYGKPDAVNGIGQMVWMAPSGVYLIAARIPGANQSAMIFISTAEDRARNSNPGKAKPSDL